MPKYELNCLFCCVWVFVEVNVKFVAGLFGGTKWRQDSTGSPYQGE